MPRRKKEIVVDETISQNEELRENENEPIEAPKLLMETPISKVKKERTEKQIIAAAKRSATLKQKQDALIAQKALELVEQKFNNKPTLPIKEQPNDEVIIVKKKRKPKRVVYVDEDEDIEDFVENQHHNVVPNITWW
jgi:hypothetical protein